MNQVIFTITMLLSCTQSEYILMKEEARKQNRPLEILVSEYIAACLQEGMDHGKCTCENKGINPRDDAPSRRLPIIECSVRTFDIADGAVRSNHP